jgi:hypothetical protein
MAREHCSSTSGDSRRQWPIDITEIGTTERMVLLALRIYAVSSPTSDNRQDDRRR